MVSVVLKKRIHMNDSLKYFNSKVFGVFLKTDHSCTVTKREKVMKVIQHLLLSNR